MFLSDPRGGTRGGSHEPKPLGRVLVIEDWPEDQRQFEMHLDEVEGVEYEFAWDGFKELIPDIDDAILPLMRAHSPDLLLLDLAWTKEDEDYVREVRSTDVDLDPMKLVRECPIGGFRLLDAIRRCREQSGEFEDAYIIVVTQFSQDPIARAALSRGANEVIQKWESNIPRRINDALWISTGKKEDRKHE